MHKSLQRGFGGILAVGLVLLAVPIAEAAESAGVVNINKASAEQLGYLPRIGPAVAGRIIEFREKNGPFKTTADLLLVRGIGDKTFDLIEPYVTITGETSLGEKVTVEREGSTSDRR